MSELLHDAARHDRAKAQFDRATLAERWMVATWYVDEAGQIRFQLEFENWKEDENFKDFGEAHTLLRKRLSEHRAERVNRPGNDGTQAMGMDPPASE